MMPSPSDQQLDDRLLDHYLSWREECVAVDAAYRQWGRADRQDRALAHAAYVAALDLEQHAARCYSELAASVSATDPDPHAGRDETTELAATSGG